MPGVSRRGVFLSYRRDDAGPYARSLQLQLSQRVPDALVFMDLDSIEAGLDFAEVIEEAVNSCAVLVALIGRQWATVTDEDGARRLDNPNDYVRFEVTTALERGVRVIPVLIDGARALRQQDLPEELHKLARLNAHKMSYDRYQDDADRLLDLIQRELAAIGQEPGTDRERELPTRDAENSAGRQAADEAAHQAEEVAQKGTNTAQRNLAQAARLLTDAERIANSIPGKFLKEDALRDIARALAATDPDRAERIANSITDEYRKAGAVPYVAAALAATDPDRAERIANSITGAWKENTLLYVAAALAATDPDRAERIASFGINNESRKAAALSSVATALAATEPDRAERIARSINNKSRKAVALSSVATALAATDPGRAARLLTDAEHIANSVTKKSSKVSALIYVAQALAATSL
jgi:hypothetical protein